MVNSKTLSVFVALAASSVPTAANVFDGLERGAKWNICIHKPIKHDSPDDIVPKDGLVYDIDMEHARDFPGIIPTIKESGKVVLCYFNAGALQDWDADKDDFPKAAIGKTLGGDYEDEWYLDIRNQDVVELMYKRLEEAAALGCDGVDPDNVDAWAQGDEDATGFGLTQQDYTDYLIKLAQFAHDSGSLVIGQKNAPAMAPALVETLDFAVLESCREWDFCEDFQVYVEAGKPVFQIEYPVSIMEQGELSPEDYRKHCQGDAGDAGFSKVLKRASAQLDGWTQYCDEEPFEQAVIDW
ncbi:glycoside hydrolase superfamily [Emericellopsis atlantica]|uniref:alpha-galactosidase n=1 Tax=Emericellopsis atlantica TaxID=2614577 RepID=A0A9P8CQ95_9HYPO|nr:glycoside hydrolase superfamily [Emericellopsis atlantica]KAG9253516.1 glycoside hydrolase superfamily [Emericellopsis atlantica]